MAPETGSSQLFQLGHLVLGGTRVVEEHHCTVLQGEGGREGEREGEREGWL